MRIIYIPILVCLFSCNKGGLNGRIEKRQPCDGAIGSKSVYLVNTSKSKRIEATVKHITYIRDSIISSFTSQEELAPGDEHYLGCDIQAYTDPEVGVGMRITLNERERLKIDNPELKIVEYNYKYEVTGETEVKKKEIKKQQ